MSKIERVPINIQTSVTPFVQRVVSSELIEQKSNTTKMNTEAHTKEKQSFMVSEKRAILSRMSKETPALLVGGRQIRETFEEPRAPLSIPSTQHDK